VPYLLFFDEYKIEWAPEEKEFRYDGVLFRHGDRVSIDPGKTALFHIRKWWESVVVGHCHRQAHVQQRVRDKDVTGVEIGCMCTDKAAMSYDPRPNWQRGFVILIDGDPRLC